LAEAEIAARSLRSRVASLKAHRGIAIGLALGLALGLIAAASASPWPTKATQLIAPIGTLFLNLVRMVVVPLVAATVFTGVARLGDLRKLGRLGLLTMTFFWTTLLIAISMGMAVMTVFAPLLPETALPADASTAAAKLPTTRDFLVGLVPSNPIAAAADGALLPLIVFVAVFGAAATAIDARSRQLLLDFFDAITGAMVAIVHWALKVAPLGVFALAASTTATYGWSMLQSLLILVVAVLVALVLFYLTVYVTAVRFLGRVPASRFMKACVGPIALAFSTTSSAASLPALYESAAALGISPSVSSFVLSLGSAINRTGSALFQGAAIIFFANMYDVPISAAALVGALFTVFLLAQTIAGVPSAGVVTLAPALATLGIPIGGLPMLLGIDRIPDMARTATQVTGHLAAAIVVDRFAADEETAT
jgi:proton glutamate symport protein